MKAAKRKYYEKLLTDKRERLELYKKREAELLLGEAQSYNIGSRSKSKFNVSLSELRDAIKALEAEINERENLVGGTAVRKVVSIIPSF